VTVIKQTLKLPKLISKIMSNCTRRDGYNLYRPHVSKPNHGSTERLVHCLTGRMAREAESGRHTLPSVLWESNMATKTCRRCGKDWSVVVRWRHHCRFCGQLVCDACSHPRESYAHIPKPVRACWPCSTLIRALKLEEVHQLEFHEQQEENTRNSSPRRDNDSPSTIADEVVDQALARRPTNCDILTVEVLEDGDEDCDDDFALDITPTIERPRPFSHRVTLAEIGAPERTGAGQHHTTELNTKVTEPHYSFYHPPLVEDSPVETPKPETAQGAQM
jgi:hypothetical protein